MGMRSYLITAGGATQKETAEQDEGVWSVWNYLARRIRAQLCSRRPVAMLLCYRAGCESSNESWRFGQLLFEMSGGRKSCF